MTEILPPPESGDADVDPTETSEWLEALDAVVEHDGVGRARELLGRVVERAQHAGSGPIGSLNTPYVNTIPASLDEPMPGDQQVERRARAKHQRGHRIGDVGAGKLVQPPDREVG